MPPTRGGRRTDADADEEFRVDPAEEDEEEEPVADDEEDEEVRRKKQREVDAKNGFDLWGDVQRDKKKNPPGPLARLHGNNTLGPWRPDQPLPVEVVKAYAEIGHPLRRCSRSRKFVETLAKICVECDVPFPMPGKGYTTRTWIAMLLIWCAPMRKGGRRRLQLERAAFFSYQLLKVSATAACALAPPKPGACKVCVATAIKLLKRFPDADEIDLGGYIKVTRIKKRRADDDFKLTLLKKKALFRDHLELSLLFRGWVCVHCNSRTLHKLDSLSSDDYEVFGRRVYVNCTTFI
jgi:hypothetical protein